MTIDLNNESGQEADEPGLVALATFALSQLRIHPQAELSILLVDEDTMSAYHEKYMDEGGPTDVLSFPMDELRPPADSEDPPEGLLGDIVLCPAVTSRQAAEHGRAPDEEAEYLLVHGLLHLLGFDHADETEKAEMFGLKDKLLTAWAEEPTVSGTEEAASATEQAASATEQTASATEQTGRPARPVDDR